MSKLDAARLAGFVYTEQDVLLSPVFEPFDPSQHTRLELDDTI
jgi:hypothetical protein